jgi:hypothetical protein
VLLAAPKASAAGPTVGMGVMGVLVGVKVTVAVGLLFEVGELVVLHPVIKAIGSIAVKIKNPKRNFFTFASPELFFET